MKEKYKFKEGQTKRIFFLQKMDLKEEDESGNEGSRQLFLVGAPRDPLVSTGAIVASGGANDEINSGGDLQSTALAGLMSTQSSSVCFPTKFSKCTLLPRI